MILTMVISHWLKCVILILCVLWNDEVSAEYLSEFTHRRHLGHDTELNLNKDAGCGLGMRRHVEKRRNLSFLLRRKKKRVSAAFFETVPLQISTALSFRVPTAHERKTGDGREWESSIGRFALGHLFASLHVVATVTAGAAVPLGRFFWFLYGFVLDSGIYSPPVFKSQRTPACVVGLCIEILEMNGDPALET